MYVKAIVKYVTHDSYVADAMFYSILITIMNIITDVGAF